MAKSDDVILLVREKIDAQALIAKLKAPEDGAVVVFDGFVRNNFKGQRTLYLEYESYEAMAYAKMREIGAELHAKFPIHRVAIVHRLGRLEIGETSVVIVVTSAHRAAAFDACRYAIDTLKRVVPIWKKEYFAGGAVWAEGEKAGQEAISPRNESTS
jgi:molybdopterin synthase catalytic subunit